MKVTSIGQIENTERDVYGDGFRSLRLVLAKDGVGFSVHKTIIPKGEPKHWHYKNHLETCFCVSGKGVLYNLDTNEKYQILPDTIYILNSHDNHTFEALEDTVLISVFNPPVTGNEIHDESGSYPCESKKEKAFELVKRLDEFQNHYDAAEYLEKYLL